ncbi:MAG: BBE domain-containing protein, partial [Janthinobacterium lividum]
VLAAWQDWTITAPRELWSTCKILANPSKGNRVQLSGTWVGSASPDKVLTTLLSTLPKPDSDSRRQRDYAATMAFMAGCSGEDAAACLAEARSSAKRLPFAATSSILAHALPDEGVEAIVDAVTAITAAAPLGLVEAGSSFDALGGAVTDVGAADTAFPWRSALATVQHTATYTGAAVTAFDEFVTRSRTTLEPWTGTAAYANYADPTLQDPAAACWGENLPRLTQVRGTYDPSHILSPTT